MDEQTDWFTHLPPHRAMRFAINGRLFSRLLLERCKAAGAGGIGGDDDGESSRRRHMCVVSVRILADSLGKNF